MTEEYARGFTRGSYVTFVIFSFVIIVIKIIGIMNAAVEQEQAEDIIVEPVTTVEMNEKELEYWKRFKDSSGYTMAIYPEEMHLDMW